MSEVKRYSVIETALCIGGKVLEGEVEMVRASEHDAELAALREELAAMSIPSEDELIANGLGYPIGKEDAVKLHFAGIRSGVITILEAWDAIGHDIGCNPSKDELLDSLRNMAAICEAHGNDMPDEQPAPVVYTTQGMLDIAQQIPLTGRIGAKVTKDERWNVPLYAEQRNAATDIEAAAKTLAACMDYPWEHMPENGRALMRRHAKNVIDAALKSTDSGASE